MQKAETRRKLTYEQLIFGVLALYAILVYGSMAMMSIGAGIVGAVFLWALILKKITIKDAFRKQKLYLPTLFLTAACVWSLMWASISGLELYGRHPDIHFIKDIAKLWHLWFPFLLFSMMQGLNEQKLTKLFRIWLGMGLVMAVVGIVQYYFPIYKPMILPHTTYDTYDPGTGLLALLKGRYHATGFAGFHLSFASIFAFPTGVWLAMTMLKMRRDGFTRNTKIMLLGCVLFLITNLLTYSKTTWALIPAMILGFILIGLKGKVRWISVAALAVLITIAVNTSEFRQRFEGRDSMFERVTLWEANLDMIKKFPLFGVGWHHNSDLSEAYYKEKKIIGDSTNQQRPFISHAHNNFLDQLSSTGVVGFLMYLWWNAVVLVLSLRIYRAREVYSGRNYIYRAFALGALGGWFCLHVGGMTQTNFWDAKVMHQMGFVVAMTLRFYSGLIVKG